MSKLRGRKNIEEPKLVVRDGQLLKQDNLTLK
jgi:hypothetical protein